MRVELNRQRSHLLAAVASQNLKQTFWVSFFVSFIVLFLILFPVLVLFSFGRAMSNPFVGLSISITCDGRRNRVPKTFKAKCDEDFVPWTLRFETLLESKDILQIIETDPMPGSEESMYGELKEKVDMVNMWLSQSLADVTIRTVAGKRKTLFKMYEELK